jgi:hypothetical protein
LPTVEAWLAGRAARADLFWPTAEGRLPGPEEGLSILHRRAPSSCAIQRLRDQAVCHNPDFQIQRDQPECADPDEIGSRVMVRAHGPIANRRKLMLHALRLINRTDKAGKISQMCADLGGSAIPYGVRAPA